jgi:hypothetical protein
MHLSIQAPKIYTHFMVVMHWVYGGSDDEDNKDGSKDDNNNKDTKEEDRHNMRHLKEHKMTKLQAFTKKHTSRCSGR